VAAKFNVLPLLIPGGDKKQGGWGDLFNPAYSKGVLIGCMLFVFQQFSGINAIVYFSSSVFKKVSQSSSKEMMSCPILLILHLIVVLGYR
jgi:hypothetical protein